MYSEKILQRIREDYRKRRMDAKEGEWKTGKTGPIKGKHYHTNENGQIDMGNPYMVASMQKKGAKVAPSMEKSVQKARKSMEDRKKGQPIKPDKEITGGYVRKAKGSEPTISGIKSKEEQRAENARKIFADHPNLNETNPKFLKKADASTVGSVASGRNGDMKPKSDTSRMIDTKDAMGELKNGTINSLAQYMDKDGNLDPERQKLHDEIVNNYFKDKIPFDGQPTMIMSGGGPASGKSFVTKGAVKKFKGDDSLIKIDPDEIKQMLPGFEDMATEFYEAGGDEKKAQNAAAFYHEESSALAKRIYQYALENGMNVVYDGTGDGSVNSVKKKIQAARDAGCKVEGEYVTINNDEALKRNKKRYEHACDEYERAKANGGYNEKGEKVPAPRLVPDDVVLSTHRKVSDISTEVASLFDKYTLYDNNGGAGEQVAIAECVGDGKLRAVKGMEDKLQNFLDKGVGTYKIGSDGVVETIESAEDYYKKHGAS